MKTRKKTLLVLSVLVLLFVIFSFKYYTLPQKSVDNNRDTEVSADTLITGSMNSDTSGLEKIATLTSPSGKSSKGELYMSFDGQFYTTSVLATLDKPGDGKYYEAWLVKESPSVDYFPIGRMFQDGNEYTTTNMSELSRPDYHKVIVTEEIDNGILNQGLGQIVLTGTF